MTNPPDAHRKSVIHPIECFQEGWQLIRDQYWLLLGISVVGILIGSVVPLGILMGPMMCGIYLCYLARMRGEPIEFGTLFRGFDYFVQSLIATLIYLGAVMVILIPLMFLLFFFMFAVIMAANEAPDSASVVMVLVLYAAWFGVIMVVSMVAAVFFTFAYPLIVDRKLDGIHALKLSVRAGWDNLGGMLGLLFLGFLLSFVGMLACYVGAFFIMPIYFGAIAVAYRKVFPELQDLA